MYVQPPATDSPAQPPPPWVCVSGACLPDGTVLELVHLAGVVRWVMAAKRLGFVPAVRAVHAALQELDGLRLYFKTGGGVVCMVGTAHTFGLTEPSTVRRVRSRGIGDSQGATHPAARPLPAGVTPGISAALYVLRNTWGGDNGTEADISGDRGGYFLQLSQLAMPCEQAAALWGCDVVQGDAAQVSAEWTGKKLLAEQAVLKVAGVRNSTQLLVMKSGLTEREIRRRISDCKTTKSSAMGSVVRSISGDKSVRKSSR